MVITRNHTPLRVVSEIKVLKCQESSMNEWTLWRIPLYYHACTLHNRISYYRMKMFALIDLKLFRWGSNRRIPNSSDCKSTIVVIRISWAWFRPEVKFCHLDVFTQNTHGWKMFASGQRCFNRYLFKHLQILLTANLLSARSSLLSNT